MSDIPSVMSKVSVLGGTGEVGRELVDALIREPSVQEVRLFSRKASSDPRIAGNPKIKEFINEDMSEVTLASEETRSLLVGSDAAFSAFGLGQPSQHSCEELERVDLSMPEAFFRSSRDVGVPVAAVMTAYNADSDASIWFKNSTAAGGFYSQVKGRLEDAVNAMQFPRLVVFRPAAITGNPNSGFFANSLMDLIGGILPGGLEPISKENLGQAMATITAHAFSAKPISTSADGTTKTKKVYTSDTMNEVAALVQSGSTIPSLASSDFVASSEE